MASRGLNANKLAVQTGLKPATVHKALSEGKGLRSDTVAAILKQYPDINPDWLLLAEGSMLRGQMSRKVDTPSHLLATEPQERYGSDGNIIVLDTKAAAGLFKHHGHQEHWAGQPRIRLFGPRYTGNGLFAIQVEGDSMEPVIHEGDWLVIRALHDREQVRDGRIHVVVTKSGVVTKRLRRSLGGDTFLCESDNPKHKPYHLGADEVPVIYDVLGLVREHVDDQPHGVFHRLLRLESAVAELLGRRP